MFRWFSLFLFFAFFAWGDTCTTSVAGGTWTAAATWGGTCAGSGANGTPAVGDVANVNHTVYVTPGTVNISTVHLGTGGTIIPQGGATFTFGDLDYDQSTGSSYTIDQLANSLVQMNGNISAVAGTPTYKPTNQNLANSTFKRTWRAVGTSGSHAYIQAPNGRGVWGTNSQLRANGFDFTYTELTNLDITFQWWTDLPITVSAVHCKFTSMKRVKMDYTTISASAQTVTWDSNEHFNSTDATVMNLGSPNATFSITNNVFDKTFMGADTDCSGTSPWSGTLSNNSISGVLCNNGGTMTLAYNLYKSPTLAGGGASYSQTGTYFYQPQQHDNPHPFQLNQNGTLDGIVFDLPNDNSVETGDMLAGAGVAVTPTIQNTITLPTLTGKSPGDLITVFGGSGDTTNAGFHVSAFHNTWAGGDPVSPFRGGVAFEHGQPLVGAVAAYKSNISWSLAGNTYFKFGVTSDVASPTVDSCADGNCDYNTMDSYGANTKTCSGCANQAIGYVAAWTNTPGTPGANGAHDFTASPVFANHWRRLARWDIDFLGEAVAPAWADATSYTQGTIRSVTDPTIAGGKAINYICIASHTSDSLTKPGIGAFWETGWKVYAETKLNQAILANTTYVDGSLGCTSASPCKAVETLVKWVRRGFTPQNPIFYGKAHDGTTVGAAQMDTPTGALTPIVF